MVYEFSLRCGLQIANVIELANETNKHICRYETSSYFTSMFFGGRGWGGGGEEG